MHTEAERVWTFIFCTLLFLIGGGSWGWGAIEASPESIRMREIENFVRPWGGGGLEWGKLKILTDRGGRGGGGMEEHGD